MTKIEKLIFKPCTRRPGYDYYYAERGGWVGTIELVGNFWLVTTRYYEEEIYSGEFPFAEYAKAQAKAQEVFEEFVHNNLLWEKQVSVSQGVTYIDYRHVSGKKNCIYQIFHKEHEEKYQTNVLWKENGRYKKIEPVKKI